MQTLDKHEVHSTAEEDRIIEEKRIADETIEHSDNKATAAVDAYSDAEHEPQIHLRTWLALAAMLCFNISITLAAITIPGALSYIGAHYGEPVKVSWVAASFSCTQAALAPLFASICDVFQVRKPLLLTGIAIAVLGSGLAPGSESLGRLIAAQSLIGIGASSQPLGYAIPSEILPRKWRPFAQAVLNIGASLGAIIGPLSLGALTRNNPDKGWANFWWVQFGLWLFAGVGVLVGYRPPPRHTRHDGLSLRKKLALIDFAGAALISAGLVLVLVGISLGGENWSDVRVYVTIPIGALLLVLFVLYEWRGTTTGMLSHAMFRPGRGGGLTFYIAVFLLFVEGMSLFAFTVTYNAVTNSVFTRDPFIAAARQMPYWVTTMLTTMLWAVISIKTKRVREPLALAFVIFGCALAAMATVQPDSGTAFLVEAGLAGLGFSGLIVLIFTVIQFSVPHSHIMTATAIGITSRAIAASVASALYVSILRSRLSGRAPTYIGPAVVRAGLPASSLPAFIPALAAGQLAALPSIPGVTPAVIAAGVAALQQAFVDSARVIFIIGAALAGFAAALCFIMGDQRAEMDYVVEAPVEELHAKDVGRPGGA